MLLPSTVRRLVTAAPQSSLMSGFAPTSACARMISATPATPVVLKALPLNARNQYQRRYSSSNPSSPSDSPKNLPDDQMSASPAQSSKSSEKRGRRKVKDSAEKIGNLPSVPSTQHVPLSAVALSSFFSLHRPMSVTQGFPKAVTDDAFAQIFAPRTKAAKHDDVVSTLSRTVDELEQPVQNVNRERPIDGSQSQMHTFEFGNSHGSDPDTYVHLNTMSGPFLPFRPPPRPQPKAEASSTADAGWTETEGSEPGNEAASAAEAEQAAERVPLHRTYKAVFTLEETTDRDGNIRIVAHSPALVDESADESTRTQTFLGRMALRQMRQDELNGRPGLMLAISVRRQRKLKMKKKKFKKLQKRTRNERRKLERI